VKLPEIKLPDMKAGLTISALVHAALLLWALISFAARPLEAAPKDGLPVDIISDKDFSELTKGVNNAPKEEPPKPLVEKIDTPKSVEDSSAKISQKPEIKATKAETPPPAPEPPKPPEKKVEKKPQPKVDPIAEAIKKEEQQRKRAEREKPQPKFDPNQIAALLDKRTPQREAAAGDALVPVPGLGTPNGSAPQLSQSEVTVVIHIGRDRKLSGPPRVVTSGSSPMFQAARDNAMRAVYMSQPFDMLKPEHYDLWKEIEITFDPRYMNGG
jgi:colicin import membrane protein